MINTPFESVTTTSACLAVWDDANDYGAGLRKLVLLNSILQNHDAASESIAKQRLIFFVQHVLPWLQDKDVDFSLKAEACRALAVLLPFMKDIYGSYWSDVMTYLTHTWAEPQSFGVLEIRAKR